MSPNASSAQLFRCQPNAFGANNSEGKACTCCKQWKPYGDFDKNKSKSSGRESHCKVCVSKRKARNRKSKTKLKRGLAGFTISVCGELKTIQINSLADVLGASMREVLSDAK